MTYKKQEKGELGFRYIHIQEGNRGRTKGGRTWNMSETPYESLARDIIDNFEKMLTNASERMGYPIKGELSFRFNPDKKADWDEI